MPNNLPSVQTSPVFQASDKALAELWAQWQPGPPRLPGQGAGKAPTLDHFSPGDKPLSAGNKAADKAAVEALATELDALQNLFYADKRYKLLVVLQGTDTSGKDGTIRGVFGRMSALGVHAVGWKAPTETELAHDYLWRIHQQMPQAGDITVFNRSHYEDVLVPVVNGWITPEQQLQRLAHINDFERMLSETGTIVLKFLLHISPEEQRERLQERLDDPAKHWKFSMGDIEVRKQWADYRKAYNTLLAATHTPWAPWTIVPADSKTHRNLMVATLLREVLRNLDLRYPTGDAELEHFTVE
ncbi:PPK2 family polyphosphate kinase [Acidovorax sp.]|jgi:PPK2 family polyphosphate:nucleotide phosphotransferase|uniref:PPK2 family polyphosphate kinase n=1 Tax=Acidovorax sp. TaxID=1872122 RepID=UPI0025BC0409|nr:PPK2 family polyphosphate kinase [Acidovorax sp.]MBL7087615.1 polyphosphate--nucleotide phosphotransferase [Acidovorax sp.]